MNNETGDSTLDVGDLSETIYPSTRADGPIFAIILAVAVIIFD